MGVKTLSFILGAFCALVILTAGLAFFAGPPGGAEPAATIAAGSPFKAEVQRTTPTQTGPLRSYEAEAPPLTIAASPDWAPMGAAALAELRAQYDPEGDLNVLIALERGGPEGSSDGAIIIGTEGLRDGDPLAAISEYTNIITAFSLLSRLQGGGVEIVSPAAGFDQNGLPAAAFTARSTFPDKAPEELVISLFDFPFDRVVAITVGDENSGAALEARAIIASLTPK